MSCSWVLNLATRYHILAGLIPCPMSGDCTPGMSDHDEAVRRITPLQSAADLNAAPAKAAAVDHNKPDDDFQGFVRQALIQNKQSLEGMVEKLDHVLANQKVLENRLSKLEPEVERNSSDIKDVIKTLDCESERINSYSRVGDIERDLTAQKSETDHMAALVNTLQSQVLDLQRYTHSFNIRIFGIPEAQGESCKDIIDGLLKNKFGINQPAIENAHGTGSNTENKPKQIIARFHSRFTHCAVMVSAGEKLQGTGIRFVDDLIPADLEEKKRLKSLITDLYNKNMKPRFIQGRLYANRPLVSQNEIKAFFDNQ